MKTKMISAIAAIIFGFLANSRAEVPKTLLDLSNVTKPPIEFNHSVLVIIDAQQEYENGKLPLTNITDAIKKIRSLLIQARKQGVPIIHVMHEGDKGGLFDPNTKAFES